jgi:hypothetical protein
VGNKVLTLGALEKCFTVSSGPAWLLLGSMRLHPCRRRQHSSGCSSCTWVRGQGLSRGARLVLSCCSRPIAAHAPCMPALQYVGDALNDTDRKYLEVMFHVRSCDGL